MADPKRLTAAASDKGVLSSKTHLWVNVASLEAYVFLNYLQKVSDSSSFVDALLRSNLGADPVFTNPSSLWACACLITSAGKNIKLAGSLRLH